MYHLSTAGLCSEAGETCLRERRERYQDRAGGGCHETEEGVEEC